MMELHQRLLVRLPISSPAKWQTDWLTCFLCSSLVVGLGVAFAQRFVLPSAPGDERSFIHCMVRWDGGYYRGIARDGYSFRPGRQSTIHFWPLYPLLARGVTTLSGLPTEYALVLVSHLCFAAALFLLGKYIDLRLGAEAPGVRSTSLLALAFLPAGLFFHMAYTESLFLLLCILELYWIERGVHPLAVTLIAALAIVTRPPGVALLVPLAVYVWRRGSSRWQAIGWLCICLPLALSGLAEFLLYCNENFRDWLAPIRNRTALWRLRELPTLPEKVVSLLTFRPGWEIFQPGSPGYWLRMVPEHRVLFSIFPANPLYFVAALVLLGIGTVRRWLNHSEILLTICLLLIPYWAAGHETNLVSMARYAFVAPPLYLVLGRSLARFSCVSLSNLVSISGSFLFIYTVQFSQGYWII